MKRRFRTLRFAFRSLLGELLLWLMALLTFLWILSVVTTYQVANNVADRPYDEQLAGDLAILVNQIHYVDGHVRISLSPEQKALIEARSGGRVFFQVLGPRGELIFGDHDMPWADIPESADPGSVRFRNDEIGEQSARIAYRYVSLSDDMPTLLVQAGETRQRRSALATNMVSAVIVPQFIIIPVAVLLVYLGLTHGITPLQRLQEELRRRRPSNLSPIDVVGIPEEIRPLIEALNDVMLRLDSTLGAQRRFIADAAHQLKTPLTGLRSQIELMQGETDPAVVSRSLRHIARSADNLSRLVQQLLSLTRAEAVADRGAAFEPVDLNALAREVATELADKALAKRVDLGFDPNAVPVTIAGVPLLLHEMLVNLVDNAIKYTPAAGHVTVRVMNGKCSVVEVEDSGIGIPDEERHKIFDRFYRVLGHESDGSGLGLSIVREIADLHEATLAVEDSSNGSGVRVRVGFPSLESHASRVSRQ